ncbi:hypothetical protein GCM10010279_60230 [Streptomyces mutabilis]|nr:hypothetical protein GCM10010279_60230 [Streptomyces mutabilis]
MVMGDPFAVGGTGMTVPIGPFGGGPGSSAGKSRVLPGGDQLWSELHPAVEGGEVLWRQAVSRVEPAWKILSRVTGVHSVAVAVPIPVSDPVPVGGLTVDPRARTSGCPVGKGRALQCASPLRRGGEVRLRRGGAGAAWN